MTAKGFDRYHIELIWKLNKGEINFEEYLQKRGLYKNHELTELIYIVNDNQYLLNEYLSNISIGLRCRAMKHLFNLKNNDISKFTNFSKSSIGYFISENMTHNKHSESISQRNTSQELLNELAIVLDLPVRYIANTYAKYDMKYIFDEYEKENIKKRDLHNLIEGIVKIGIENKRNIYGVKIINKFFEAGEKMYLNARVDIREEFFTVEIHLENEANINTPELFKLESSIGVKHEIYIRNAFLRDNKKLIILVQLNDSLEPNISYLHEKYLWRNVLYCLKEI